MAAQTQFRLKKHLPPYWTATFDHPPINLIDPDTIHELIVLVGELETEPE